MWFYFVIQEGTEYCIIVFTCTWQRMSHLPHFTYLVRHDSCVHNNEIAKSTIKACYHCHGLPYIIKYINKTIISLSTPTSLWFNYKNIFRMQCYHFIWRLPVTIFIHYSSEFSIKTLRFLDSVGLGLLGPTEKLILGFHHLSI